jgi:ApaG protein
MTTAITSGIRISVDCKFESQFSNPAQKIFLFSYGIEIENRNDFPIQLLRRTWHILDSSTRKREVEGEGVIGQQPIINPGENYRYRSNCDFSTDTGKMHGMYQMKNLETGTLFDVEIPAFTLMVPHKLN